MAGPQDGSYSSYFVVTCEASLPVALAKATQMAKTDVSGVKWRTFHWEKLQVLGTIKQYTPYCDHGMLRSG